jgi:hypothetical protein
MTHHKAASEHDERIDIALLALPGSSLRALGAAALGIAAGPPGANLQNHAFRRR